MYRIGICDDDKEICSQLEEFILQYARENYLKMECYIWYTGETFCNYLKYQDNVDLVFLDIELVNINGIEVGTFIRNELENMYTSIVFISSKSKYAMNLFKIQPLDFLIKPLTLESISAVLDMWFRINKRKNELFEYKLYGSFCYLPYSEIVYFNSDNKKINIILKNSIIQYIGKLKDIYHKLPENFIMIHQSYIINCDYIAEFTYTDVRLVDGIQLNISQTYRKQVREKLKIQKRK